MDDFQHIMAQLNSEELLAYLAEYAKENKVFAESFVGF